MKVKKFYATWCGPCKSLSKVLEDIKTDIPIEEVDIDNDSNAVKTYGIRSVPTMIMLDDNDKEIKRAVGMMKREDAEFWLRN